MIVDNAGDFLNAIQTLDLTASAARYPKQLMLIQPYGFGLSAESAKDNAYMQTRSDINTELALKQHSELAHALQGTLPVKTFQGKAGQADAVFPNNVFATDGHTLILGAMRYPHRQSEAYRDDILDWFKHNGYSLCDLNQQDVTAELTGSLVIDHARNIGYCGLTQRCNLGGAQAMHKAFKLKLTYAFELHKDEYHTNVVMSVLAGRAMMIHPESFADRATADAIMSVYKPYVAVLDQSEKNAYCGNTISIDHDHIWLSSHAHAHLSQQNKEILNKAGFAFKHINLSEIEKAGGSLRCCIMEVF